MLQLLSLIILFMLLVLILIEDLRHRAVAWPLFPLTTIFTIVYSLESGFFHFSNILFNLLSVGLILSFLWVHFKLIKKENLQHKIGLGDVLFIMILCFGLDPFNFLIFIILSSIIAIFTGFLLNFKTIPLAGIQAGLFIPTLLIS